ncbi:MAG: diacylglycerol/polyprenol kinase family protein [Thermoplasmatota archaeon]
MVQDVEGPRSEVWIRRKLLHALIGAVFLLSVLTWDGLRWGFLAILVLGYGLSLVQARRRLPVISWFLDRYDKSSDHLPGQGPLTFFLGALYAWFIFGGNAAFAGIIVLTFGDPWAYILGKSIGGPALPWNPGKTVVGSLSLFISSFAVITLIWGPVPGLMISLVGAVVESMPFPNFVMLDDNVTIPFFSALTGWMMVQAGF